MKARLKYVVDKLGPQEFLARYVGEREAIRAGGGRRGWVESAPSALVPRDPGPREPRAGLEEFARTSARAQRQPEHVAVAVRVPLGDLTAVQLRSLGDLAEEFSEERELRTTVDQNVILRFVRRRHLASLHSALHDLGLAQPGAGTVSDVTSCPGAYSCRLAVTSSRAMASAVSDHLLARPEVAARAEKRGSGRAADRALRPRARAWRKAGSLPRPRPYPTSQGAAGRSRSARRRHCAARRLHRSRRTQAVRCRAVGGRMRDLIPRREAMAKISLDWWTVIAALGAIALIKFGHLPVIPW